MTDCHIVFGGPPVDEFHLRDGERYVARGCSVGCSVFKQREGVLEELEIGPIGRGGDSDIEVIHIGDYKPFGDLSVNGGYIYEWEG